MPVAVSFCMNLLLNRKLMYSFSFPATLIILALLFSAQVFSEQSLLPFSSDGCSSFPDGTTAQNELWLSCCTTHDRAYWKGGSYSQRLKADIDLQECVAQLGEDLVSILMLTGVRVGGTPFLPTTFRWGYGWPYPRAYGKLTDKEKSQVSSSTIAEGSNDSMALDSHVSSSEPSDAIENKPAQNKRDTND